MDPLQLPGVSIASSLYDLRLTATEADAGEYSLGLLKLDVGILLFVPVRVGEDERLLVAMPRDALVDSLHEFPRAPAVGDRPATAMVNLNNGGEAMAFFAVLDGSLIRERVVFLVDGADAPMAVAQFDSDYGGLPTSASLLDGATELGFIEGPFAPVDYASPEAYMSCDSFAPVVPQSVAARIGALEPPGGVGAGRMGGRGRGAPPFGRGLAGPAHAVPPPAGRGARGQPRPTAATLAPQLADLEARMTAMASRLPPPAIHPQGFAIHTPTGPGLAPSPASPLLDSLLGLGGGVDMGALQGMAASPPPRADGGLCGLGGAVAPVAGGAVGVGVGQGGHFAYGGHAG